MNGLRSSAEHNLAVVDYHSALVSPDGKTYVVALTVNGVHPTPAGYGVMVPLLKQAHRGGREEAMRWVGRATTIKKLKQRATRKSYLYRSLLRGWIPETHTELQDKVWGGGERRPFPVLFCGPKFMV
jgi:hypothetical protein